MQPISFKRHRFPPDVIRLAIWLYFRFTTSLRDVEDMLAERGHFVSYETVRCWVNKFGPAIAANLRRRRPCPDSIWHLDERCAARLLHLMWVPSCTKDEGRSLEAGRQGQASNHCKLRR
jgi:putative transposase